MLMEVSVSNPLDDYLEDKPFELPKMSKLPDDPVQKKKIIQGGDKVNAVAYIQRILMMCDQLEVYLDHSTIITEKDSDYIGQTLDEARMPLVRLRKFVESK
jgi:hypothetical protein